MLYNLCNLDLISSTFPALASLNNRLFRDFPRPNIRRSPRGHTYIISSDPKEDNSLQTFQLFPATAS